MPSEKKQLTLNSIKQKGRSKIKHLTQKVNVFSTFRSLGSISCDSNTSPGFFNCLTFKLILLVRMYSSTLSSSFSNRSSRFSSTQEKYDEFSQSLSFGSSSDDAINRTRAARWSKNCSRFRESVMNILGTAWNLCLQLSVMMTTSPELSSNLIGCFVLSASPKRKMAEWAKLIETKGEELSHSRLSQWIPEAKNTLLTADEREWLGGRLYSRTKIMQNKFIAEPSRILNCDWSLRLTVSFK